MNKFLLTTLELIVIVSSCAAQSKTTSSWQTGIALYSFGKFSFPTAVSMADSAHVKIVEGFSFHNLGKEYNNKTMAAVSKDDITRMKQVLKSKKIAMPSMYVASAKDVNEWKYYFQMAKEFGMKFLVCEPMKTQWDMVDSLAGLYKIKIAIHEHSKLFSAYWHPDSVLAAIKGHPNMGACADLGHWVRSGLDPVKCLQQLRGHILGIHLKDTDESNNQKANDVTVGKGIIDFPAVVKELKLQKFKGLIYVECEHKMDYNLPDVIESLEFFNRL